MRRLKNTAAALLTTWLVLGGCGSTDPSNPNDPKPPEDAEVAKSTKQRVTSPQVAAPDMQTQVAGNSAFAFDLYQQVRGEQGNLFYSPHSMTLALAMLYAGTAGTTESQIAQALHYELDQQRLHPMMNKLDLELGSRGQGSKAADGGKFRLNIVNAIWGQRGYPFRAPYLDTLALSYGAGLNLLDFAADADGSRKTINAWVEQRTEQRIKDLLPEGSIDELTRLVLTNAIYFNAAWAKPFEESATQDAPFRRLDGSEVQVKMMSGLHNGSYLADADFKAATLPYDGHELSMVFIVPDEGKFDAVEQKLSGAMVKDVLDRLQPGDVQLELPRFEFTKPLALLDPLRALGIEDAFVPGEADLSGIDGSRDLYVSAVLHKAFVKVNEKGTEAAAATAVVVGATSVPPPPTPLIVDRPFIFLIHDHATGAILFVGRVVDPNA